MELIDRLHQVELFAHCDRQQLAAIASCCQEHHLAQGAELCRQSYRGTTFFLIDAGEALIRRVNEKGEDRPVGVLKAGDAFGITSLFIGEPRDASVLAASAMRVWSLSRSDLEALLDADASLWHALNIPGDVVDKLSAPEVEWLEPDETLIHFSHRHWSTAARPISLVSLVYLVLSVLMFLSAAHAGRFPAFWVPVSGLFLLTLLWFWLDWRNDYFAVTTRRIVHHERVLFLYEAREEAPIDRVQNVRIEKGLAASAFDYGDLIIETAAEAGVLRFTRIPSPEAMREVIFEQASRMLAVNRAAQRIQIQDELAGRLGHTQPGPETIPVPEEPYTITDANALQMTRKGIARFFEALGRLGLVPRTRLVSSAGITWRKHWIFLLVRSVVPFLLAGICGAATLVALLNPPEWGGGFKAYFPLTTFLSFVLAFGWFFWRINDWANDLYIVTDDRIIDIERHPMFLAESRREASLGVIQNVAFKQSNLVAKVFNFGDVIVQTAGPGTFSFMHVPNPRDVQSELFRRMENYRRQTREKEAAALRGEMGDWFGIYDSMQAGNEGVS